MITLLEVLSSFRREGADSAAVLLGDAEAMRVLVAFRTVPHQWKAPRGTPAKFPGEASELWRWIVKGWKLDYDELAAAAGVGVETAQAKARMLIANRLVYPDGTLSHAAQLALHAHVGKSLGAELAEIAALRGKLARIRAWVAAPPTAPDLERQVAAYWRARTSPSADDAEIGKVCERLPCSCRAEITTILEGSP